MRKKSILFFIGLLMNLSVNAKALETVEMEGKVQNNFDEISVEFKTKSSVYEIPRSYFSQNKIYPGKSLRISVPYILVSSFRIKK